ncbi:MAG: helix-hairpin-helix domain-containing protein [Candidatus Aminicenantes bacterium]|nr:helix-hairpin-helix domain-containing protein [Candidatus Aminicenantes bacterium]
MENTPRKSSLKELQTIPGVGPKTAEDFWQMGLRSVRDLQGKSPERLYKSLCAKKRTSVDRCMLYVLRCAVYYASTKQHKHALLKW